MSSSVLGILPWHISAPSPPPEEATRGLSVVFSGFIQTCDAFVVESLQFLAHFMASNVAGIVDGIIVARDGSFILLSDQSWIHLKYQDP